jgi:hypothetical protein
MLGSNLGQDTGYAEKGFMVFFILSSQIPG